MILLLMRDDKVDDQRVFFFFCIFVLRIISFSSHYLHPDVCGMGSVLHLILDLRF
jgi:hypothetical protein